MPLYRINASVRRCVAAIRVGRADIPAKIFVPGRPPVSCRLPFDDLYSPKPSVARDARYVTDTEYKTAVLGTDPPEIEVSLLAPAHARYYTHIRSVTLT